MDAAAFRAKWADSSGAERANKDAFLLDLCDVLDVPRPNPTTGRPEDDTYVFEKDVLVPHEQRSVTHGRIDLYKENSLILEAKQGSDPTSKRLGAARRDTPGWNIAMMGAYGQALGYARTFSRPVPFIVTCDIGYCFDLYATFDGSYRYDSFPNPLRSRIFLKDLEERAHRETLQRVFMEPLSLDPSLHAAKVTRQVAEKLAKLAQALEKAGHPSEAVAKFLMRCLFTMFAEDIGLLDRNVFTNALKVNWLPNPASFPAGIEGFWRTMNTGGQFGFDTIQRFNGGLFAHPTALPMAREHLELLLEAATYDWSEVEPAIFGTLIERALDPKERHALGAHYTPRAYVERLVRPTIEEPLRADWELVQAEARQLVANDKVPAAKKVVREFHQKLCKTKVLDPACGSGNFLYVTLDLFKRLESEVLALLEGLGEKQTFLHAETIRVTPGQFLGIEIKPWAKEIAELVLWIGYLQHHFRAYAKKIPLPEPVLQDYKNIECRDAVLAYDSVELVRDEAGKPVTRWDGETYKKSPVTGEDVPDEEARVPVYRYVNPRKAEWPEADFIVGNPPFLGAANIRSSLGDGYAEAVRATWPEVPESADFVMYWWHQAATLTAGGQLRRFGLITTNSLRQTFNRRVVERAITPKAALSLVFAIPDHPWVDSKDGAAVRIAMSVCAKGVESGRLLTVFSEKTGKHGEVTVQLDECQGVIQFDLRIGPNVAGAVALKANARLSSRGFCLHGAGFIVTPSQAVSIGLGRTQSHDRVIRHYRNGRDLTGTPRGVMVIDLHGLTAEQVRDQVPEVYQWVYERVKPERDQNNEAYRRTHWWLFGRKNTELRAMLAGLPQYIATVETAKHRVFQLLDADIAPDNKLVLIAVSDGWALGVMSSSVHVVWALAAGARLVDRPVYVKTACFDPFPFPTCTEAQSARIRDLAESLDAHRKRQQSLHPNLTITGMYNVLEKLRSGEALTAKEKTIHEEGLVSVLRQIHDELDAAVFEAYGWPSSLSDEEILEKLVALNAERAAEERQGIVRWLRPDFQNPGGKKEATQVALVEEDDTPEEAPKTAPAWPKKLPEQVATVRDFLSRHGKSAFTVRELSASFKGGKAKEVELVLDSLVALGIAIAYEKKGEKRWRGAGRGVV